MNKRNIGVIGSPNSEASEVFAALLRVSQPPKPPKRLSAVVADSFAGRSHTVDLGEYGIYEEEVKPPYDAKKRKRLFGKD